MVNVEQYLLCSDEKDSPKHVYVLNMSFEDEKTQIIY